MSVTGEINDMKGLGRNEYLKSCKNYDTFFLNIFSKRFKLNIPSNKQSREASSGKTHKLCTKRNDKQTSYVPTLLPVALLT